jgi:hypothetical protein
LVIATDSGSPYRLLVIWQSTQSDTPARATTRAGRSFDAERSENGKRTRTTTPGPRLPLPGGGNAQDGDEQARARRQRDGFFRADDSSLVDPCFDCRVHSWTLLAQRWPVQHGNNLRGPQAVCEDLVRFIALFYAPCEDARHSIESFLPC